MPKFRKPTRKTLRDMLASVITPEIANELGTTQRLLMCAVAGYTVDTGIDGRRPVTGRVFRACDEFKTAAANKDFATVIELIKLRGLDVTAINLGSDASHRNRQARLKKRAPFTRAATRAANAAFRVQPPKTTGA